MATAAKATRPHIVKEPDYYSGKAAIDHTRVRVMNVVFLHKRGKTTTEIQEAYPDLTPAQVYAALAYYYDNPEGSRPSLGPTRLRPSATSRNGRMPWLVVRPSSGRALSALYGRRHPGASRQGTPQRRVDVMRAIEASPERTKDSIHFERAAELGRVLVTNDEGQRQRGADWYAEGRGFPGVIWWPQTDYETRAPGDFLRAFEELARQDAPFSPYPVLYRPSDHCRRSAGSRPVSRPSPGS